MSRDSDEAGERLLREASQRSGAGHADAPAAAPPVGTLGLGDVTHAPALRAQAQQVEQTVELLSRPRLPYGLDGADRVIAEAERLRALLDGRQLPLDPAESHPLEMAMFAVARFAADAEGGDAAVLRALATSIAVRARALGAQLSPDLPNTDVVAASESPQGHLGTIADAVDVVLGDTLAAMDAEAEADGKARAIAVVAPRLVSLFREGAAVARPRRGAPDAEHPLQVGRVAESMEHLFVAARRAQLDLVSTHLDEIFDAEDVLYGSLGQRRLEHRRAFYADRKPGDFDDDGQSDVEQSDGHTLIGQILDWYRDEPVQESLQLTRLNAIITEPPRVRDSTLLEQLLLAAVQFGIGVLSDHLTDVFTTAVRSLAANPAILASGAREVGATVSAAGAAMPDAVKRGGRAVGAGARAAGRAIARGAKPLTDALDFGPVDQRALAEVTRAAQSFLRPLHLEKRVVAKMKAAGAVLVDSVGEEPAERPGALARRFVDTLSDEIREYMLVVLQRRPEMQRALELVPPAGLQQIFDGLVAGTAAAAAALRADLVARWAGIINAAGAGEDEDGTTAHGGTLRQANEQPGVLQLDVTVGKPRDAVQIDRIELNGLSESGLDALRAVKRPLAAMPMQRTVAVWFVDEYSGAKLSAGRFDVGPDGQLDLSRADAMPLAALVRGAAPDHRPSDLERAIATGAGAASAADAARGARFILEQLQATTEDIP